MLGKLLEDYGLFTSYKMIILRQILEISTSNLLLHKSKKSLFSSLLSINASSKVGVELRRSDPFLHYNL